MGRAVVNPSVSLLYPVPPFEKTLSGVASPLFPHKKENIGRYMNIELKEMRYKHQHKHSCKVREAEQSMIIQFFPEPFDVHDTDLNIWALKT